MAAKAAIHVNEQTLGANGGRAIAAMTYVSLHTLGLKLVVDGRLRGHDEKRAILPSIRSARCLAKFICDDPPSSRGEDRAP
jgi:hypothetical protein